MRDWILILALGITPNPSADDVLAAIAPPTAMSEADHSDRIEQAWDAAGLPTVAEVHTPTGGRCDLVTDQYAWEIDFAEKWAEGVGQATYYGVDLDREAGLLLLVGPGEDRFLTRAELACRRAGVRLLVVPLTGNVPLPAVGGHLVDDPLSDAIANYHGPSVPTTRQRLRADYGYTRGDLRYLSQGELERLQGAIDSGAIDPPRRPDHVPEAAKKASGRELMVLSADWCVSCESVHTAAVGMDRVRFVDINQDWPEARRLWGGPVTAIPCYVLVEDGKPVMRWRAKAVGTDSLRAMLRWQQTRSGENSP